MAVILRIRDTTWISHWEQEDALPNLVSAICLATLYQTLIERLFPQLIDQIIAEIDVARDVLQSVTF